LKKELEFAQVKVQALGLLLVRSSVSVMEKEREEVEGLLC